MKKSRAPSEAGPERDEEDEVSSLQPAFARGFVERDGDGGCGRVAIFVEIQEKAFNRDFEAGGEGVDDAHVRLMRYDAG